jgi:hypothetical protein
LLDDGRIREAQKLIDPDQQHWFLIPTFRLKIRRISCLRLLLFFYSNFMFFRQAFGDDLTNQLLKLQSQQEANSNSNSITSNSNSSRPDEDDN